MRLVQPTYVLAAARATLTEGAAAVDADRRA
jgi:hypothetical protein